PCAAASSINFIWFSMFAFLISSIGRSTEATLCACIRPHFIIRDITFFDAAPLRFICLNVITLPNISQKDAFPHLLKFFEKISKKVPAETAKVKFRERHFPGLSTIDSRWHDARVLNPNWERRRKVMFKKGMLALTVVLGMSISAFAGDCNNEN